MSGAAQDMDRGGGGGHYLRGFSGAVRRSCQSLAAIIANDFVNSSTVVTISASDRGFRATEECGTWTKIG